MHLAGGALVGITLTILKVGCSAIFSMYCLLTWLPIVRTSPTTSDLKLSGLSHMRTWMVLIS